MDLITTRAMVYVLEGMEAQGVPRESIVKVLAGAFDLDSRSLEKKLHLGNAAMATDSSLPQTSGNDAEESFVQLPLPLF